MKVSPDKAPTHQLRRQGGQTAAAHAKYRDAVEACDDIKYIEYNVSQIACIFHLSPSALANQLRRHYPDILERREKERRLRGLADNAHRGVSRVCSEQYAAAVEHLRTTDDGIRETAVIYNVSYSGLREHLLYYFKDLVRDRSNRRDRATACKTRGALTGNGRKHEPRDEEKYAEAIRLCRTTAMTEQEVCARTGVSIGGLRHHLRTWNRELMHTGGLKSTAAKYAGAIERLKESGLSTAEVAGEFGLNPETFRKYLHAHEPELASSLGMTVLANGRTVLSRSADKYAEAIRIFETTPEPLKSIAGRLGLAYKSVGGYIRRNRPDAIEAHKRLLS